METMTMMITTTPPQEEEEEQQLNQIVRGKRTKRQHLSIGDQTNAGAEISGFTDRKEEDHDDDEEKDLANCLILLAQGHNCKLPVSHSDLFVYECKTCDRRFPSFQALGGHRASHRKLFGYEEIKAENHARKTSKIVLPIQTKNEVTKSNKIHECSVCGAEFGSGQALGGHMRRHRSSTISSSSASPSTTLSLDSTSREDCHQEKKKLNKKVKLDLNLPAPEDHQQMFGSKKQLLVFSASPLVDCHY